MSSHGGARSGAGRPKGGVSQTRRLLSAAITKGLATAGRRKFGSEMSQDDETAATQTAAMLVADMIDAGQGADVLKLWAQVSSKDQQEQPQGSSLEAALKALPSASCVALVTQAGDSGEQMPVKTIVCSGRTTDNESDVLPPQPAGSTYFAPQQPLLIDRQTPGGHPPSGQPPHPIYLDSENFEKNPPLDEPDFGDLF